MERGEDAGLVNVVPLPVTRPRNKKPHVART